MTPSTATPTKNNYGQLYDPEIEEQILGELINIPQSFNLISNIITQEHFFNPTNAIIFKAIRNLNLEANLITIHTIKNEILKYHQIPNLTSLLAKISAEHLTPAIESNAVILNNLFLRRKLINLAYHIIKLSSDLSLDTDNILDEINEKIFEITSNPTITLTTKDGIQLSHLFIQTLQKRIQSFNTGQTLTGIPTGFKEIDKITHGWQKGELIILGARPGMGKTSFILSIALHLIQLKIPLAIFSLEMTSEALIERLFSAETEIHANKIKRGEINTIELKRIMSSHIASPYLLIDDKPAINTYELLNKARQMILKNKVQLLIIDYLQLMSLPGHVKTQNREQEISKISSGLKKIAKDCKIPVIAVSQLSRNVENRSDKRPMLSDLRESGAIEQDADMVCFLYRDEYYNQNNNPSNNGITEFIIAKNRNGLTGTVNIKFIPQFTKFTNLQDIEHEHQSWNNM